MLMMVSTVSFMSGRGLSVLTSLVTHARGLSFGELKQLCGLTDGNLNRHLQVLEEAKLIVISKNTDHRPARKPRAVSQCRDASAISTILRFWNRF